MFSYKILSFVNFVMAFSVGFSAGEIFSEKLRKHNILFKYTRIVLFCISALLLLWLIFNKELFHWNYDIATGEKVDHYSTYTRCVLRTVIAVVSNTLVSVISIKKRLDDKASKGE